ncbi:MAG: hypothetical protein CSB49_03725 [Proteobacteria bacterium]|nr:MAG: hypothetical protein CSB49_03725 [Pseudomonadota bacterium]
MRNSPREIAVTLADALLADIDRAERSARINRGAKSVGDAIEGARAVGSALLLGAVALFGLATLVPFWLAVTLVLLAEGAALALWINLRMGRRRKKARLDLADDTDRLGLDANVTQLNSLLADLRAEGLELPQLELLHGNVERLRRDVQDLRARLIAAG